MDNETVQKMLGNIKNSTQRNIVERMIFGKIKSTVTCQSCHRIVAHIKDSDDVEPTTDGNGVMWLLAYRQRLDGFMGFQCLCGNDSRLCEAEKNNLGIEENHVTPDDIKNVFEKLKSNPTKIESGARSITVDNFILEDI